MRPSQASLERAIHLHRERVAGHCGAVLDPLSLTGIEINTQQTWVCKVSATAALMRHEQDSLSISF